MQCTRCGAQVTPPASFCPQCGAALLPPAPGAGGAGPSGAGTAAAGGVSYAAPYPPAAAAPRPAYAGFWRRLAAFLLDNLILNILGYLLLILLIIPTIPLTGIGAGMDAEELAWPQLGAMFLTIPIGLVTTWLYYAILESSARQATLGKMALGLRVTDLAGRRLSLARATGRYFAKWVSSLTLLIGYLMAAFTEKKQALHDLIAGTLVVKD